MKRYIFLFFFILINLMSGIFAQTAKPMVAFRYGIEWHFFNTDNKLMFPVNKMIGPQMVSAFFYGRCKIGLPAVEDGNIVIRDGIINEKGIEQPLKGLKDNWIIVGVSRFSNENILYLTNYAFGSFASMNSNGIMVPTEPLYYWNEIGDGLGAGYGKLKSNPEEASLQKFPDYKTETEYEIWDIKNAKLLFKINGIPVQAAEGLISVKQNNLWGFTDKKGKWLVKPQFEEIGGLYLNSNGEEEDIKSFRSGALAVKKSGKWGLIDKNGKWLVKSEYIDVLYAGDGFWSFQKDNSEWIMVDAAGKNINIAQKEPLFIESGNVTYLSEGLDYKIKSIRFNWELEFENAPISLGDGYFAVQSNENYQIYSEKGHLLMTVDKEILEFGKFSNGLLAVEVSVGAKSETAFIDKKGTWAIRPGIIATDKSKQLPIAMDGFIHVYTGEAHIFYDHSGKIIKEEKTDGNWDMMTVLQDNNSGFWAPQ
jgi:hypothetical protein